MSLRSSSEAAEIKFLKSHNRGGWVKGLVITPGIYAIVDGSHGSDRTFTGIINTYVIGKTYK